jgi:glycosyltransferase involved in cell wall biosynthesis
MLLHITIVDVIGLPYDGNTLLHRGLGGSESAVIYMARALVRQGYHVTVYNNCTSNGAQEGTFDGVVYQSIERLHTEQPTCDILIGSRTVVPFAPPEHAQALGYPTHIFQSLQQSAKYKIIWLHDTFCGGDHLLESYVTDQRIDKIFTLSDFHTSYVTNCQHGRRRNFEVLKPHVFVTRNGAHPWIDEVNLSVKDPNLFVYNASVTKGMVPLIEHIWPKVKARIPDAKLVVIGGYYRFSEHAAMDAQEQQWRAMANREDLSSLDITFTGIIPQADIAQYMAKASFMIFPGAFPETFGISTLEALLYNTPLLTTRFGALEETALDLACYKINYAIEPNSLFPDINLAAQVDAFVDMVCAAYTNPYLHRQKMQYCDVVKPLVSWDGIALQWKQHLCRALGQYLPAAEYDEVQRLNTRIHQVFGRRYSNPEEWAYPVTHPTQEIVVISPMYNAAPFVADCIRSVASQSYPSYRHILIDDASTDNTVEVMCQTIAELPGDLRGRFTIIENGENVGAVANQIAAIRNISNPDAIVVLLDGDDALMPNNTIFHYLNSVYDGSVEFTYGSMWSLADNIPLVAQPYPKSVRDAMGYRKHPFVWGLPYTHLRTFKQYLIVDIPDSAFQDPTGAWYRAGGDNATFYELIEAAHPDKIRAIPDILCRYNDKNPLNDYKIHGEEQTRTAQHIRTANTPPMKTTRILLAIPTNKYIEPETFKSIFDLTVPDHVELTFQYFYGYQIDQIRNLIANWAEKFDYLFSVDSDIVLPKDSLVRLLSHDKDVVSGVYIQRKPGIEIPEIYRRTSTGAVSNVSMKDILPAGLHPIDACGFGCVLVKSDVIRRIGYPQFTYRSALTLEQTVSEDVDFCMKAAHHGATLWVDSHVICPHIGNMTFLPNPI